MQSSFSRGRRELRRHEIDFVVNTGREKVYVQSAFGMNAPAKRAWERLPLLKTGYACRKLVVTDGGQKLWADEDGISHVGLLSFLPWPTGGF